MFKHGKLKKFIVLIILDGWGIAPESESNLISSAPTPQFNKLAETYPATILSNPLNSETLRAENEDVCRLSHYLLGTTDIENNLIELEKKDPLNINSLSRTLSKNNLRQLYLAGTEKFPQISYFFRGCYSKLLKGEEQILIKGDFETCLKNTSRELKKQLETRKFNFIAINLSNIDIAAHNGNRHATVRTINLMDKYLGEMIEKILNWGGETIITADHGMAEEFDNSEGKLKKAHTNNDVPFVFISENFEGQSFPGVKLIGNDLSSLKASGSLVDIAPTILQLLSVKKPKKMIGKSLMLI